MNLLYLECNMGAAGDMLMGALYELLPPKEQENFLNQMNHLNLPGIELSILHRQTCGIYGTHMHITINGKEEYAHIHEHTQEHTHQHTHQHSSYQDMLQLISQLPLSEDIKSHALAVYRLIGEAEAKVHRTDLSQIHFHEVGTLDALADVVGCCLLLEILRPDKILSSPVHVGSGTVSCAHGILPVPAPATAELLKEVPIYSRQVQGELCTPTGAALLKHFVSSFEAMPPMKIEKTGYGIGTKEFSQANCVRAFWGTACEASDDDIILSLSCNLDDITGEALGFAMEQLMNHDALDVYVTPIIMKKGRPGQLLTCLCAPQNEELLTELIFKHTTTRGIRIQEFRRHVLSSQFQTCQTPYGNITIKQSEGYGVCHRKPEYEDMADIARRQNISLSDLNKNLPL